MIISLLKSASRLPCRLASHCLFSFFVVTAPSWGIISFYTANGCKLRGLRADILFPHFTVTASCSVAAWLSRILTERLDLQ